MDTTVADTLLGSIIDGRYRIRGRVARGGMATVYTAVDERLERTVALKIIQPSQATNVNFVDRFTDEAKTIARLTHPNIVAVYDQGRYEGLPYLIMEYVQGRTLREVLNQRRRLNPVEALAILEQMLSAIAAAHRAGLVHRDVKPENVLVAEAPSGGVGNLVDSVVKVADFGLARAVEVSAEKDSGQLLATVAYVAPELVTDGRSDARTDVYSAGIVLFEMLTGRVPYDGDEPVTVAWQHVDNDVPAPSSIVVGLPPSLDDLVCRATRRDPGGRPTDAGTLLHEVQAVRDDLGAANVETALLRQVPRPQPAEPTVIVPTITAAHHATADRPAWARLPGSDNRSRSEQRQPTERGRRAATARPTLQAKVTTLGDGDQRARIGVLLAVAAMVLTVLGSAWWVTLGRYADAPQLVNTTRAEAQAAADRNGFQLTFVDGTFSETVDKDVVLRQDPQPGGRIIRGGVITVALSLGPERYPVPDLSGVQLANARGELEESQLVLKEGGGQFNDTLPSGVIIASDPKPGTMLKRGDSVTVTVSKGRAPITVPDLEGKNIDEVRNALAQLDLVAVEQYKDDGRPADTVIGQSPEPGTGVDRGAEVKLDVSKGPPQVVLPRVVGQNCEQARQQLTAQGLRVRVDGNPLGTVFTQNPPENTPVAPQSEVSVQCL